MDEFGDSGFDVIDRETGGGDILDGDTSGEQLDEQVSMFETDPNLGRATDGGEASNEIVDDVPNDINSVGSELATDTPATIEDDTNPAGNDANEQLPGQMDMFEEDTNVGEATENPPQDETGKIMDDETQETPETPKSEEDNTQENLETPKSEEDKTQEKPETPKSEEDNTQENPEAPKPEEDKTNKTQENPEEEGEQKPDAEGEQKPDAEGEQKPYAEREQKPDVEGEQKPDLEGVQNEETNNTASQDNLENGDDNGTNDGGRDNHPDPPNEEGRREITGVDGNNVQSNYYDNEGNLISSESSVQPDGHSYEQGQVLNETQNEGVGSAEKYYPYDHVTDDNHTKDELRNLDTTPNENIGGRTEDENVNEHRSDPIVPTSEVSNETSTPDSKDDLKNINRPNMTLDEVQKVQGIDESGHTTGEGIGNEAFKESLPDDFTSNEVELKEGVTREDFDAAYDEVNKPFEDEIHDEWVERLNSENADRDKIGTEHEDGIGMEHTGWLEYRDDIKNDPKNFDENEDFKWREGKVDGFENEEDALKETSIEDGREVTRYGFDTGRYMTDGSNYDSLAMPYKEEFMPKNTYTVQETIANAHEGKIADLRIGDGSGGGNQIKTADTIEELKRDGKLKLNNK